ncbi:hypothetical protein J2S03_002158 [Alicyclobacillus cycloheptanicus]|uniref:Uncharacterized protein n=1 Tax=Alicyclobacillus cycloheptanicus TaxID=1457 RepID=A0ABT9XJS6_9BACL|nr:hypothetical protein [Alicyclobacillus cycloheptanicus]
MRSSRFWVDVFTDAPVNLCLLTGLRLVPGRGLLPLGWSELLDVVFHERHPSGVALRSKALQHDLAIEQASVHPLVNQRFVRV